MPFHKIGSADVDALEQLVTSVEATGEEIVGFDQAGPGWVVVTRKAKTTTARPKKAIAR